MEFREYPTSSNVERIAFYPSVRGLDRAQEGDVDVLTIRFKKGETWAYSTVSPQQWEQLRDCQGSIGSLVHKAIVAPARIGEYQQRKLAGEWLGEENGDAADQEAERDAADGRLGRITKLAAAIDDGTILQDDASVQTLSDAVLKRPAGRRINPRR